MLKKCFNFTFLLILHFTYAQVPSGYSLIAYEGFDYPNNTNIANQSGGIGWAGNWEAGFYGNSTMIVNSSGLSYTGLNVSGNKLQWGGAGQYQPHSVRRAINNSNSGIVYLRFISDFNSSSGGTDRLDLNLGGTTQASFGGNNSQQKMSILAGGLIINSTYSVYDLSLVVIQIDYTNNTTKMWVKPTLSTFDYSNPGTPDAIYNNSIAFDQISLTFRSGGQIDEITVFKNKTYLTSQGSVTDINTPHLTKYGGLVTSEINGSLDLYGKISITAPDAPIIGTAIATSTQTSVSFTAPLSDGDSPITSYTATSNPGGITGTISQAGSGSITVTGLTNGTAYTFTVTATNSAGTSSPSAASNAVTLYPTNSPGALLSGDQKNIINATNSLKAIGLTDWSELIGFTDNGGSLYAEGYSTDDYAIRETKTYLMFSENNNWNSSTKVFLAEYNYNANSNSDEVRFYDGSAAAKTENVTISSNQKYIMYTNSGTNYTVNITIADRTLPLYLDLEQYYSNARGNQVNITFADPNDAGLVFYNKGGGNYGNNTNGSSTIQFSTNIMTPALAYIDEILANGSPSRVLWFSGDMIHTLYDSCGYPYTNDFDPNYPAPQFISKTINGYATHVSDITNGYESVIAKYMNCNTIYQSVPY